MHINDHTDAELARREHAYEMGEDTPEEKAFDRFMDEAIDLLVDVGVTDRKQGLDGDQETDGFSLDFAFDFFRDGASPADYVADVLWTRGQLGFRDGEAA